jgi:hypothetical protein
MKFRPWVWFAFLLGFTATAQCQSQQARYVLLLASRSGFIEAVDPATLATIGSIHVGAMADWVSPLPDGATLLVGLGNPPESQICCALYSLDLETAQMHRLLFPAMRGVISPDGHALFAQRGNVGIDVIDLLALERGPNIGCCGKSYLLAPSPYRRWLFGVTETPSPSLDIFDLKSNSLARSLAVPDNPQLTGAWSRDTFYLLGFRKGQGTLWSVTPETQKLTGGKPVDLRALGGECRLPVGEGREPVMLQPPFVAGGRLFVYEGFGMKLDRRECVEPPSGGLYVIEPSTGAVVAHLTPSLYFMRVVANCEGTELYGIELGLGKGRVRLVRFDSSTGKILASREFGEKENAWGIVHVSLAYLFDSVVPRGELRAVAAAPPSAPECPWTKPVLDEPAKVPGADPFGFGEWYINENRTIWTARQSWRAGVGSKVIWLHPPGTPLQITGRRLDAPSPPLRATANRGYPTGFTVRGMTFPAAGCWEVTAKAGSDVLTFVTPVGAPQRSTTPAGAQR